MRASARILLVAVVWCAPAGAWQRRWALPDLSAPLRRRLLGGQIAPSSSSSSSSSMTGGEGPREEGGIPPEVYELPDAAETKVAHSWSCGEAVSRMRASVEDGLSSEEARRRRAAWGRNELVDAPRKSKWAMLWDQFDDRLVQILVAVAIASAVLGVLESEDASSWVDPAVICLILVSNAAVGVWQESSADDSLEALKRLQPKLCCCKRDGEWDGETSAAELVPGDVVYLRVGDKVPADVRLLQFKASTFATDEAALTGEAATVQKSTEALEASAALSARFSMAYSGTVVTAGHAVGVVVATGMSTEIGRIQAGVTAAKADRQKTPLTVKLDEFADQLTLVVGAVCVATFAASAPRFGAAIFGHNVLRGAMFYAKAAVALGVAAIPEGLPAVITLCLSLGTRRMATRRVVVRRLPSVETLGCTTVICSDKTGTLTTNQMTATALLTPGQAIETDVELEPAAPVERAVSGTGYDPSDGAVDDDPDALKLDAACLDCAAVCALCNDARLSRDEATGAFARVGEPTEAALKVLCEKLGLPPFAPRSAKAAAPEWRRASDLWTRQVYDRLATLEFDRARKSMSVLVRPKSGYEDDLPAPGPRLLVKGAPDAVLKRCVAVRDPVTGVSRRLSNAERRLWQNKCAEMASRPLRCLALATRDLLPDDLDEHARGEAAEPPALRDAEGHAALETELTLVGVVGIRDPPRPEAAAAIDRCERAGIRVFVISGDSRETAVAVARELGILGRRPDDADRAFEGDAFFDDDRLDDDRRAALLAPDAGNAVFCRTAPADKQRIIKLLADYHGDVTAMTGDGVNDAPALQQAAIGVAMGVTGTEVAKEAADMILVDDDFASIVAAVEEGRTIYKNMQSFICFLLSCNFGEVATVFGATLLGLPDVLSPLHLLWVNLVTDGPPATALGFNPPDPQAMSRPPRRTDEALLSPFLALRYALTGAYVGLATIAVYVRHFAEHGVAFGPMTRWATCDPAAPAWADFAPLVPSSATLDPCAIAFSAAGALKPHAQTLALTTLVVMEMIKALSAVSLDNSLLQVPFWRNPFLCAGVALPVALHLALLYTPHVRAVFGLTPLSAHDWTTILAAAAPILLVEELLKAIGRHLDAKADRLRTPDDAPADDSTPPLSS